MNNYLNINNWHLKGKDAKRRKAKWRRQRITKGYCDSDLWDLDIFYLNLLVKSLREHAEKTYGWQETIAPTLEDYKARINNLADKFEDLIVLYEEPPDSDVKWYKEHTEKLFKLTKEAFAELAEVFWGLWF